MKAIISNIILISMLLTGLALAEGPPAKLVKVGVVTERQAATTADVIGTLTFDVAAMLSSETSGLAASIHFAAGDRVKKNDKLISLNTDFLNKEIAMQQKQIEIMGLRIKRTKKDLDRYEALFSEQAASESDFDDLTFNYKELVIEKERTQTQLDRLLLQKEKSTIYAPFDGVVLEKMVNVGDWVQPGKTLCRMGDLNSRYIRVPLNEKLLPYLSVGDELAVTITALNKIVTGTAEGLLAVADAKTKNVFLKVRVPDADVAIENLSATVSVPVSEKRTLRMIPRDALVSQQGQTSVYTIVDGKASPVPVRPVYFSGTSIGVETPDITTGMQVIIEGNERLQPGAAVAVTGE